MNNSESFIVVQRLKRLQSIIRKLKNNHNIGLGSMQDIGGIRIIVPDISDIEQVHNAILNGRATHDPYKCDNYIDNPKTSGYRGIHQCFRFNNTDSKAEYSGLTIEVQIRTELQHLWAMAVETIDLINGTTLKSGIGNEDYLNYFRLVSALFSIQEKRPIISVYADKSKEYIIKELKSLENELKILHLFESISKLNKGIMNKNNDYFIIILSKDSSKVSVLPFTEVELEKAVEEYKQQEQNNDNKAVVLISCLNYKQLVDAYPSYFLDTNKFVNILSNYLH